MSTAYKVSHDEAPVPVVTNTTDLTFHFNGIQTSERLPEAYKKAVDYLRKHQITCRVVSNQDYRSIKLLDPADPVYAIAQCRVTPQAEQVVEYTRRFNAGEILRWAPIAVAFGDECALSYGNTRFGGMVKSKHPYASFILVDPDNTLSRSAKTQVLAELAAFSNAKEKYHQEPDKMTDVAKQARTAWDLIKATKRTGTSPILAENRRILAEYDAASDKEEYRRKQWFETWMDRAKGKTAFSADVTRSRIYNEAFELTKKSQSKITEFTDQQIKQRYDKVFSDSKWNPEENHFEKIVTRGAEWQFEHLWGTKDGKTGNNCINNLRNYILRTLYINDKYDMFEKVSVVISGDSGASSVLVKNRHIESVIKMATDYNLRPARKKQGIPFIYRIFFPQMFRSTGKRVDCDIAYEWDETSKTFVEKTSEQSSKVVHEKQCYTCKQIKKVSEFGICNSKGIKDGLQPRCIECSRKGQRAYAKRKKKS